MLRAQTSVALALILLGAVLLPLRAGADSEPIAIEGVHYKRLMIPVQTPSADRIQVTEFFSYGCIHCFRFEPLLERWQQSQPPYVELRRVPAIFNRTWQTYAQAYYTASALAIEEISHPAIFSAIHRQRRRLHDLGALARFFTGFGISEEKFTQTFHSFGVQTKVRQADALSRAYQISGVPTMAVAGKYTTITGPDVRTMEDLLQVVDFLIEKEYRENRSSDREEPQAAEHELTLP